MVVLKKSIDKEAFTLVELVVVIAVISILASITTVGYNSVRERANNAKIIAAVSSYLKIFEVYKAKEGEYPITGNDDDPVCLGKPEDYPATSVYRAGWCATWSVFESDTVYHGASADFNDELEATTSYMPSASLSDAYTSTIPNARWSDTSNGHYRGILYNNEYNDETGNYDKDGFIHYFLSGTQDCPQGESFSYGGVTECVISLYGSAVGDNWGMNGGEGLIFYE